VKRIFIAIDLPADVKEVLSSLQTEEQGVRWVHKDQLHITLLYLGNLHDRAINEVVQSLADVNHEPFDFQVNGAGCFPDKNHPKVIYAAVSEKSGLMKLRNKIVQQAGKFCDKPDNRKYKPHITLARIKGRNVNFSTDILLSQNFEPLNVSAESYYLYESRLTKDGAKYKKLNRFDLI